MKLGLLGLSLLGASQAHLFESCLPSDEDSSPMAVSKLFVVRDDLSAHLDAEQKLAITTLSGFLARTAAGSHLGLVSKSEDLVWLSEVADEVVDLYSLDEVLAEDDIPSGDCRYVLCKVGDNSTNAALSFSAASDECTIVATEGTAPLLESFGIKMAMNLTSITDPFWALDNLSGFNQHVSVLQNAGNPVPLSDFAVKCRALHWWGWGECGKKLDDPEGLTERALGLLTPGDAVVVGWGGGEDPEWNCVHASTSYGSFGMIAADQALNLAVLNASPETVKHRPAVVRSQGDTRQDAKPKHTVCFVMSDGDNVQWILNDWSAEKGANGWWASAERGNVKMGWTLSPSLAALAPAALQWIMAGATENDQLIAGPSGATYAFVNDFPDTHTFKAFAEESSYLMGKAGMRIVNVLNDEGFAETVDVMLAEEDIDAVFLYEYNGYSELGGAISFVGGKPVIGGRFNLWSPDFYDVDDLVDALKGLPNMDDVTSSDGYTLIPVHAWSHSVEDIVSAVKQLEADGRFDVVLPDELVARVAKNVAAV